MLEIKGNLSGRDKKIGIVVSRFNEFISKDLLNGCIDTLKKLDVSDKNIVVIWAPGAFEIPSLINKLLNKRKFDAVIALGAIIRGDTPHFEYIAGEVAKGIATVSLENKVPVVFGIITADTIEQAIERAGTKAGNKGRDAAFTAIEMANIYSML